MKKNYVKKLDSLKQSKGLLYSLQEKKKKNSSNIPKSPLVLTINAKVPESSPNNLDNLTMSCHLTWLHHNTIIKRVNHTNSKVLKMIQLHMVQTPKTGMCVQKYKRMLHMFKDAYNTCMYFCTYVWRELHRTKGNYIINSGKEATNKLPPSCDL